MRFLRRRRRTHSGLVQVCCLVIGCVLELSVTGLALLGSIALTLSRNTTPGCKARRPDPRLYRESRYALAVLGLLPLLLLSARAGGGTHQPAPPARTILIAAPL